MAEFTVNRIMNVPFELTSRYLDPRPVEMDSSGLIWYVPSCFLK